MVDRQSTARSRTLGDVLAAIRTAAGFDVRTMAAKLDWEETKVYRVESGKRSIEDVELITWLTICGVGGAEIKRLTALNRESSLDSWLLTIDQVPRVMTLASEEARATVITNVALGWIPGLLQIEDYISAVIRPLTETGLRRRLTRQQVLRGPRAAQAIFYIDELALRCPVGGRRVMHDQLVHLLVMAGWKNISVRVVPSSRVQHRGLNGAFVLLDNRAGRPLVFLDTLVANIMFENPAHVAEYRSIVDELHRVSLDEEQSKVFIARQAAEFGFQGPT